MDPDALKVLKKVLPFIIVFLMVIGFSMLLSRKNAVSNSQTTSVKAGEKIGRDQLSLLTQRLLALIEASDKSANDRDRAELSANIGPVAQSRRDLLLKHLQQDPVIFVDVLAQQELRITPGSITLADLQNQGLVEKYSEISGKISKASAPNDSQLTYVLQLEGQPNIYYVIYADHPIADAIVNQPVLVKGWLLDKAVLAKSVDITLK